MPGIAGRRRRGFNGSLTGAPPIIQRSGRLATGSSRRGSCERLAPCPLPGAR